MTTKQLLALRARRRKARNKAERRAAHLIIRDALVFFQRNKGGAL